MFVEGFRCFLSLGHHFSSLESQDANMQRQDKGVNSCNGADQLMVHAPSALTEEWGLAKCEECFNCI